MIRALSLIYSAFALIIKNERGRYLTPLLNLLETKSKQTNSSESKKLISKSNHFMRNIDRMALPKTGTDAELPLFLTSQDPVKTYLARKGHETTDGPLIVENILKMCCYWKVEKK